MIVLDGAEYDVKFISLKRTAEFLDSYANRTEDGNMHRKLIGVYFNYQIQFEPGTDPAEYTRLWNKLTEPVEFHTVTLPGTAGDYTFTAYFSGIADELMMKTAQDNFFKNLTVSFIAKSPARR